MAQYRDIDLPTGVPLRVNGDLTIPSNSLSVGGQIVESGTALSSKYTLQADSIIAGSGLSGGGTLATSRTLSVNFSGNGSGNGVSYANHNHNTIYPNVPISYESGNAITCLDTSSINEVPLHRPAGLYVDIKASGTVGLSDGGSYVGVLTLRKYGLDSDFSKGNAIQIGATESGNIYTRISTTASTWGGWTRLLSSSNFITGNVIYNNIAGQSVLGNMTVAGTSPNLFIGDNTSTSSGNVYIRSGTSSTIQLDGSNAGKLASVNSYIGGNGNALFTGTISANAITVISTSTVANLSATYINGIAEPKLAKNESIVELSGKGIHSGMAVTAQAVNSSSVDIAAGIYYTDSGRRFVFTAQAKGAGAASASNHRIDALYIQGSSTGANEGSLAWVTGTVSATPVAPAIPSDGVLIANIWIQQNASNQTTITPNHINSTSGLAAGVDMKQIRPVRLDSSDNTLRVKTSVNTDSIKPYSGNTVLITAPVRGTFAKTMTIASGVSSVVWTHNFNLADYAVTWSTNSPNRHIYWSSKGVNAVTFNLDDTTDITTTIDAVITAF